ILFSVKPCSDTPVTSYFLTFSSWAILRWRCRGFLRSSVATVSVLRVSGCGFGILYGVIHYDVVNKSLHFFMTYGISLNIYIRLTHVVIFSSIMMSKLVSHFIVS